MSVLHLSDDSFNENVINEKNKPVFVDFWATWCGPCRMLAPIIEELDKKYEKKLKVCKVDTDQSPLTAQNYQITGIPCCILFDKGKEIARFVGYRSAESFEAELKQHISID